MNSSSQCFLRGSIEKGNVKYLSQNRMKYGVPMGALDVPLPPGKT
jgi:hypothetical protein